MLLAATLVLSLALGAAFVAIDGGSAPNDSAAELSDDQAVTQVVSAARQIVAAARLEQPTGGYSFVSCTNRDEPPYQVALYMNFAVPQGQWRPYLEEVGAAMAAAGWVEAPTSGEHFGRKSSKDGVTALLGRNVDNAAFATLRVYGECRNNGDHRDDNPAWTEVAF